MRLRGNGSGNRGDDDSTAPSDTRTAATTDAVSAQTPTNMTSGRTGSAKTTHGSPIARKREFSRPGARSRTRSPGVTFVSADR